MTASVQVIYPVGEGTTFDIGYYADTHMAMVKDLWGDLVTGQIVTRGDAGGPNVPPRFHAIATFTFADQSALRMALSKAGPLMADVPNFTNVQPQMLIGEQVA
jgi:uncharacterized protein (TIGR02118 family)